MERKRIICLFSIVLTAEILLITILFIQRLRFYNIFLIPLLIITTYAFFDYYWNTRNEDAVYNKKLNEILRNYDSVLVKIVSLPEFEERNIVSVAELDDMIIAQMEIRKPISYFEELCACTFILLDEKEAYVYVLKKNDLVRPIIQEYIDNSKKKDFKTYTNLLSDIDKTTIIKLENSKSYRISPIRKQKEKETEILSLDNEII